MERYFLVFPVRHHSSVQLASTADIHIFTAPSEVIYWNYNLTY